MPLNREEVEKLLGQEKARMARTEHSTFFREERLIEVAKAVTAGRDRFTIEGRIFIVKHNKRWPNDVLVTVEEGFVPSGWFNKDKLRSLVKQGV